MKFKAVIRLAATLHGRKVAEADRLAQECGRSRSTVLQWQTAFKRHGEAGLLHCRADRGLPRVYSDEQFQMVIQAAARLRRWDSIAKEYRKLKAQGLPGCKETFRAWIRRLQKYGYSDAISA